MKPKILIVEDSTNLSSSLKKAMETEGYEVYAVADSGEALAVTLTTAFDVVVTDLQLADQVNGGLTLITELHTKQPRLPVILMTAHHTTQTAIEATKRGAYEYILKPFHTQVLLDLVAQAVESRRLMAETVELGTTSKTTEAIVGNSRPMQAVYKEIGRVSAKPFTVLIRGETGTGKELVARAIYQHSDRYDKPFIVVNCAAIPETLLESELFGHEPGAFTGASARRIGRFEQANGGTIFLDEIGDMRPNTQAKLLRVLQEKTIQRLGGKETIRVDVRIIAATHCDLETAIQAGEYRQDLYYRLNDAVIWLPPLRERREDVPLLVNFFLAKHSAELGVRYPTLDAHALSEIPRTGQSPQEAERKLRERLEKIGAIRQDAMEGLEDQRWPGNVRELENVVRRAVSLGAGRPLTIDTIRQALALTRSRPPTGGQTLADCIADMLARASRGELVNVAALLNEDLERELYGQAIKMARGNQAKAAKWLGVSRPTMREKLKSYGLRVFPESSPSDFDI
jgi:DNA-binding NtrC family response regulator